jgi:hypothetical protein
MAVTGALWYQGENNIGDCFGPKRVLGDGRESPGGGPRACGVHNESTGYACKMEAMVEAWRTAWNSSAEEFPFGIVTLAGGSDEGQPYPLRPIYIPPNPAFVHVDAQMTGTLRAPR